MPKFAAIVQRFPDQELAIRRLCGQDDDFLGLCADYQDASAALRHWESSGTDNGARADEYRHILGEFETEIFEYLKNHQLSDLQRKA